jgi:hypothetical protein
LPHLSGEIKMLSRFAFLLLLFCVGSGVGRAQENIQAVKPPQATQAPSTCAHVPPIDTDSDDYNSGYRDGFKEGCKAAASAQHTTSGAQVDDATESAVRPVSFTKENAALLTALASACRSAADKARSEAQGHDDVWNLRYRVNLLAYLVQHPEKCQ